MSLHSRLRPVLIRVSSLLAVAFLAFFSSPAFILAGRPGNARPAAADAAPAVHLANISTRLAVGTNDNVLIAGFIVTGTQPKKIVVRALGPLVPVNENLADPTLELHDSTGATVAENDNWRDTQEGAITTTIPPASDYDSAILRSVNPGAYTAILAGKGATTGVALVEVYDLDLSADSKLANISSRGFVGQNDNVLIGGTIVLGSGSTTVLFRAIGPSLPLGGKLQDPTMELYDGQGHLLEANDNWADSNGPAIEATTISPTDPREAAILRSLTPGAYTAIVRGKNNTTGVAVVEAYQIN